MNAKKAKKLRRQAEEIGEPFQARIYGLKDNGQIVLHDRCIRAIYQRFKRDNG